MRASAFADGRRIERLLFNFRWLTISLMCQKTRKSRMLPSKAMEKDAALTRDFRFDGFFCSLLGMPGFTGVLYALDEVVVDELSGPLALPLDEGLSADTSEIADNWLLVVLTIFGGAGAGRLLEARRINVEVVLSSGSSPF